MRWSTHFIVGATVGLIFAKYVGGDCILMGLAGAFFGVLPDADIILDTLGIADHRGVYSHSLGASMVIGAIASGFSYLVFDFPMKESIYMGVLGFLASFLHTVTDALTYSGARVLWPLNRRKFRGFIRYSNLAANLLVMLLCLAVLYFEGIIPHFFP